MDRSAVILLQIALCLTVFVVQTYCSISWAREVYHRTKRQAGCQPDSEFKCTSGQCIDNLDVCDAKVDCEDGSDETASQCSSFLCPRLTFRCNYGACIDGNKKCNGQVDCVDGSDEAAPACPGTTSRPQEVTSMCKDTEFKCTSGQCIDDFSVCDGKMDCADGSDETMSQCSIFRCPLLTFRCNYGACIDDNRKCNGQNDCADGSDEAAPTCPGATSTSLPQVIPLNCRDTEFKCTSGECINRFFVCDGRVNCADGSDEISSQCSNVSTTSPPQGGCILPPLPEFGTYTGTLCLLESNDSAVCRQLPGTPVPQSWALSFKCNEGYYFKETWDERMNAFCSRGKWSPKIPVCRKMCSHLVSLSVDIKCYNGGGEIECSKPVRPGTRARVKCKQFYTKIQPHPYKEIICRKNGQWSDELFNCRPVCGKRNRQGVNKPLIGHGYDAKHGEFPWHVGLYMRYETNQWEQMCGGSLISPHIVLTAAHCVFSEFTKEKLPPEVIKVGLGKYYREWNHDDEPYAVKADVRAIVIPPRYYGQSISYTQDIALLGLVHSVEVNLGIMPACIDWDREFIITPGALGTLAGWGKTEHGTSSDILLYADLPYIGYRDCITKVRQEFQHYVTPDKFCAGFSNGTGAEKGDSGGGLMFVQDNLYYVNGIVSTKLQNSSSYITFTNISNEDIYSWLISAKNLLDN